MTAAQPRSCLSQDYLTSGAQSVTKTVALAYITEHPRLAL
jgi:hypothetical protein